MSRIQHVIGVLVAFLLCYTSFVTSAAAPEAQATVSICGLNAGNDCSSNCTKYKIGSDQCLTYWAGHFSDGTAMFKCLSPRPFGSVSGVLFSTVNYTIPRCTTRDMPQPFVDQAMGECSSGNYYNAVNHTNGTVTIQAWWCNYTCKGQRVMSPFGPPPADLDCRLMAEGPLNECIRPPKEKYPPAFVFSAATLYSSTSIIEMSVASRDASCTTPVCSNCTVWPWGYPVTIAEGACLVNASPATNSGHVSHFSLGCETSHQVLASLPSLSEAPRKHLEAFSAFVKSRMPPSRGGGASSGKRVL